MANTPDDQAVRDVHGRAVIVEGHRDCYEQIHRSNLGEPNPIVDRLLPRLRVGGVDALFYAIGGDTIAHSNGMEKPLLATLENIDLLNSYLAGSDGSGSVLLDGSDLPDHPDGTVRFILHLEGCKPLEGSLGALRSLHSLGIRSAQLTWNVRNEVADGLHERDSAGGLTRFGRAVVREMQELGMIVDLSHIAAAGFWQAVDVISGPFLVTHANASAVFDHPRNLTDEQLRAVGDSGGVVGVHCLPAYVDPEDPTVGRLVDHVVHMVSVIGIDHVGIGADFPTSDGPRPAREQRFPRNREQLDGFDEIDELGVFTAALLDRGFTPEDAAKVLGENFARVIRQQVR